MSSVSIRNVSAAEPGEVLVASTDIAYARTLANFLRAHNHELETAADASEVLRMASRRSFDVIVLDVAIRKPGDVDVLSYVQEQNPATRVILLFDVEHIEDAIEGLRQGAFFYLPHSSPPSDVALVVDKAMQSQQAEQTIRSIHQSVFEDLHGRSPAMRRVLEVVTKVAPTDSTVLLLGESGSGKEVMANLIHRISRRHDKPFIAINCAALPEALLESEMFGHVRGAFTGADRDKAGLFEEADGGTIFLDEIGDMSPMTQAKLLRVLQNGEVRRVGSSQATRVNVRVLAATNVDLVEAVARSRFREDLYFRLNVVTVRIPPLRERRDAMPGLIGHFLARSNQRFDKNVLGFDEASTRLLQHYEFPGNVRELESVVAHAVILADDRYIRPEDLPDEVRFGSQPRLAISYEEAPESNDGILTLADVERRHIEDTLEKLDHNQTLAAKHLGISRSTLWRKLREYGLDAN